MGFFMALHEGKTGMHNHVAVRRGVHEHVIGLHFGKAALVVHDHLVKTIARLFGAHDGGVVQHPDLAFQEHFVQNDGEHHRIKEAAAPFAHGAHFCHAGNDLLGHIGALGVAFKAGMHKRRNQTQRAGAAGRTELFDHDDAGARIGSRNGRHSACSTRAADHHVCLISLFDVDVHGNITSRNFISHRKIITPP